MDSEDFHRRIDEISRENANLVETVRQLRDALEDANATRLDDLAIVKHRREVDDQTNRETVSAIRDVLDRNREDHSDSLAALRLEHGKAEHQLKEMIASLRDLVEDRDSAQREADLLHEDHVRSLNNEARQIALSLRLTMEEISQQALEDSQELRSDHQAEVDGYHRTIQTLRDELESLKTRYEDKLQSQEIAHRLNMRHLEEMIAALREELEEHSHRYRIQVAELNEARIREERMHSAETERLRDVFDAAEREHRDALISMESEKRAEAKLLQEGSQSLRESLQEQSQKFGIERDDLKREYSQTISILEATAIRLRDEIEFVQSQSASKYREALSEKEGLIGQLQATIQALRDMKENRDD